MAITQKPGVVPLSGPTRASQVVTTIIPANSSIPLFVAGNEFYLTLATDVVRIKPNKGSESKYTQGTGSREVQNPFDQLQLFNDTPNNIIISIFIGFGQYIDNRVILYDPLVKQIVYATYPVANSAATINILDRSGEAIVDINGTNFLALARVGIYVSNIDLASSYSIENLTGTVGAALVVFPQTDIVFPVSGNYRIHVPASTVNAIVSEVYNAVTPTLGA